MIPRLKNWLWGICTYLLSFNSWFQRNSEFSSARTRMVPTYQSHLPVCAPRSVWNCRHRSNLTRLNLSTDRQTKPCNEEAQGGKSTENFFSVLQSCMPWLTKENGLETLDGLDLISLLPVTFQLVFESLETYAFLNKRCLVDCQSSWYVTLLHR